MRGYGMEFLTVIWSFITSHWSNVLTTSSSVKSIADMVDSVKKVLPERLDSKKTTQEYLEQSVTILNDQSIKIEDKEWELNTRQELVKSMVQLTAIEAGYNLIRGTILVTATTVIMYLFMRFIPRRRTP
jgi:hypothetical protein